MKVMIISDVHQDANALEHIKEIFIKDKYEKLIILGDIEGNAKIGQILSYFDKKLILLRGNCDLTIYDKYLPIKPLDIYVNKINGYMCYFAHGHKGMPKIEFYDKAIYFSGHTHIGSITNYFTIIMANPGSISKPRNNLKSYIEFTEQSIILYSLENKTKIAEYLL